jgi:hypothetical protein
MTRDRQCENCGKRFPAEAFELLPQAGLCVGCLSQAYIYTDREEIIVLYVEPVDGAGEPTENYIEIEPPAPLPTVLPRGAHWKTCLAQEYDDPDQFGADRHAQLHHLVKRYKTWAR